MSRSCYTSSERRGILLIAFIVLLLIASGVVLSLCGRPREKVEEIPVVVEHPELIDSTAMIQKGKEKANKTSRKKTAGKTRVKEQKVYRQRSPLDEPV